MQHEVSMKYYNMHESLAKTVDNINAEQKFILETKAKAKDKKTIQIADQYHKSLEDLRTTLLASKQKSIFADEKKLREEISESYGVAVSGQQRPSNTVIAAAEDLSSKVDAATEKYSSIKSEYRIKYDKALAKEKIGVNVKP